MSKQIEKFRTKSKFKEDYGYEYDIYEKRAKKRNKSERTQLKRLRSEEILDYQYGDMKRTK